MIPSDGLQHPRHAQAQGISRAEPLVSWICEIGNDAGGRHQILEEFETFRDEFIREHAHSGDIAARPVQARDKTGADWVGTSGEDD